jgi:hypothetical protein
MLPYALLGLVASNGAYNTIQSANSREINK